MTFATKLQMLFTCMFILSGSIKALTPPGVKEASSDQDVAFKGLTDFSAQPSPTSVLQLSQGDATIPDVSEVLQKPHEVLKKINTHVDALTASLSAVREQHAADVAKQKADLEQKLAVQKAGNARIAETNEKTAIEIVKWKELNLQLRWRASGLRKKSESLRSALKIMLANMSYAHEFTDSALGDVDQKLRKASDMQILFELDAKDAERHAEIAHAESLHTISPNSIAMLEVGAKLTRKHSDDAKDLVKMLSSALNDLSVEQNASLASLQDEFEALFHKGQERHTSLVDNQTKLNETRSSVLELNQRLHAAVDHLTKATEGLEAQIASARTFLETLSQRALPGQESHQLVPRKLVADQTTALRQRDGQVIVFKNEEANNKSEAGETEPRKTNLRADAVKAASGAEIAKTKEISSAEDGSSSSWLTWVHDAKDRLFGNLQ